MKNHIRLAIVFVLALLIGFTPTQPASAAPDLRPITIDGVVYDKNHTPVAGLTVVAWCGGINFFGGSGVTDSNGHYVIKTDGEKCPFDNELTVTTDVNNDGLSDGARHTQVHTQTTINIYLGKFTSVAVPEYDWVTASLALLGGAGIVAFVKRKQ